MDIEKLLLTKEELPILYENCFTVPIHPRLLDPTLNLDPKVANEVFPQVAMDWYQDLEKHTHTLEDQEMKSWIQNVFLKEKPRIKKEYGMQVLNIVGWKDETFYNSNGFVRSLSINRDGGGTLYFDNSRSCKDCLLLKKDSGRYILFSEDKLREFSNEIVNFDNKQQGAIINRYSQHNVDSYPGALFLRNWAIAYINEVFQRYHKELF